MSHALLDHLTPGNAARVVALALALSAAACFSRAASLAFALGDVPTSRGSGGEDPLGSLDRLLATRRGQSLWQAAGAILASCAILADTVASFP